MPSFPTYTAPALPAVQMTPVSGCSFCHFSARTAAALSVCGSRSPVSAASSPALGLIKSGFAAAPLVSAAPEVSRNVSAPRAFAAAIAAA